MIRTRSGNGIRFLIRCCTRAVYPASGPPATPAAAGTVASRDAELPIAGYDELSLPSLRARLRNLDVEQLQVIVDHERTHANRADIVTMFERRIAKLSDDNA